MRAAPGEEGEEFLAYRGGLQVESPPQAWRLQYKRFENRPAVRQVLIELGVAEVEFSDFRPKRAATSSATRSGFRKMTLPPAFRTVTATPETPLLRLNPRSRPHRYIGNGD